MASLKYRCLYPDPETTMCPVAASQYFYHDGVNAVYKDSSGNLLLALTATATLYGIAIVPKGRGAGSSDLYWKSSATAGADKIPVIRADSGYKFVLPNVEAVTDAMKGNAVDLIAVNDGTATTVDTAHGSTDVFIVEDLATNLVAGAGATDVVVKMNVLKQQAD